MNCRRLEIDVEDCRKDEVTSPVQFDDLALDEQRIQFLQTCVICKRTQRLAGYKRHKKYYESLITATEITAGNCPNTTNF